VLSIALRHYWIGMLTRGLACSLTVTPSGVEHVTHRLLREYLLPSIQPLLWFHWFDDLASQLDHRGLPIVQTGSLHPSWRCVALGSTRISTSWFAIHYRDIRRTWLLYCIIGDDYFSFNVTYLLVALLRLAIIGCTHSRTDTITCSTLRMAMIIRSYCRYHRMSGKICTITSRYVAARDHLGRVQALFDVVCTMVINAYCRSH
jgi:hypothetical protein